MKKKWICSECGHEVYADERPTFKWKDGHICSFKEVWDYCFKCGKPLTDMVENEDWFEIKQNHEAFPICKDCNDNRT